MSNYLVSDESENLVIEDADDDNDILVTYNGKSFFGYKISILLPEGEEDDIDPAIIKTLVDKLCSLCEFKHNSLIESFYIIYSGSQEDEGVVPLMLLCSFESKSFKTLNQTAYLLDQIKLANTLSDIALLLNSLHAKDFYHGALNADNIFFDEVRKVYCLHPKSLVEFIVSSVIARKDPGSSIADKVDIFQFANTFRKMFLDYPNLSNLLSCSISYILEDCLKAEPLLRPSAERVSDAIQGIMKGFNSMQLEIDRLKKQLLAAEQQAGASKQFEQPSVAASPKSRHGKSQSGTAHKAISGSLSALAVHEKRASVGSFDRTLQLFKFKLKQVIKFSSIQLVVSFSHISFIQGIVSIVWELDARVEAMEVTLGIEDDKFLVFVPPVTARYLFYFSFQSNIAQLIF